MIKLKAILLIVSICLAVPAAALAFEPAPGNRAYPVAGHDLISGDYYDLEEYRGKWVFLEFWASW